MDKQHVQLPNNLIDFKDVDPKDLLIYLSIKRFMNQKTRECFPSEETIAKTAGCSRMTVRKSINKLVSGNFMEVHKSQKDARYKCYYFPEHSNFEPFSYDFLDNPNLTFSEKAYLAATQQFMIKENGIGKTMYNNMELANKINMPIRTIRACDNSLQEKGFMEILSTNAKDSTTGLTKQEKIYNLEQFGQAVVFALRNHENRITKTEESIESLKKDLEMALKEINRLKEKSNEIIL